MGNNIFHSISKSGFVRSVFFRVLSIFIVASVAISAIAFFSFATEIRRNTLSDRQSQLSAIEGTISKRMDEVTSIAYNISTDPDFYLEAVENDNSSGREMSNTLARYLVGNSFIEHLAYYRKSEPDKIYISSGERSLSEFYMTSFGLSEEAAKKNIQEILSHNQTDIRVVSYGKGNDAFFAYMYTLPQLSANPQAFVLMLIPLKEVAPLFETMLRSSGGEVGVFDAYGKEIYRFGQIDEEIPLDNYVNSSNTEERFSSQSNTGYVMQKVVSDTNGWTYVSVMRHSDTLSGIANKQLIFIFLMLLLLLASIIIMLVSIIVQYRPISKLAEQLAEKSKESESGEIIDERILLSNVIDSLRDDSEQKQKFETAYHEAEAASKAKSVFLSSMSHDIRTPMNAVVGMTAIALRHTDDPEYVKECLKKVQVSSKYLMDIINNVLDMSRIEAGRFTLTSEVIELRELIDSLVVLVEPGTTAKSQRLQIEFGKIENTLVIGDSVHIMQVFVNILSNSVKFTPDGGAISVKIRQTRSKDGYGDYVFVFSDTGIGMPPEFVGQVFDTFTRANGSDVSKVEGTGLGMAIAKNLVELMGGTITCESRLGRGTTFIVTMHMKLADAQSAERLPGSSEKKHTEKDDENYEVIDLEGKRILLVEDNAMNREIATKIIAETGARVTEATNGKDAVSTFSSKPEGYFDIILMDIQMPLMNGYEATEAIRALDRADAATVPIYAMTANTFDEDVKMVKEAGMNGHIGKPYTPQMLYDVLDKTINNV